MLIVFAAASLKTRGKADNQQNGSQYALFRQKLTDEQEISHAADRLTFGPRPGDIRFIQQLGLDRWIQRQLDPEKVPENSLLTARLAPLESTRLSIHELYVHYPNPRMIAAFAAGKNNLPDDPELRSLIVRLAYQYLQKKDRNPATAAVTQTTAPEDEEPGLEPATKLEAILSPEQIGKLRDGRAEEKKSVLASVPPEKYQQFAWALQPRERRPLLALAPVPLRRQLMLSLNPQNLVASDLSEAKLLRAVYSDAQLQELMVDFWFNHFNVFINKGADRFLAPAYERDAIRPHVFGKFYDLLLATAQSPAMLFYLDNWESAAPDSPQALRQAAKGKRSAGLNENYGRELLELHTLGVDGGYSQHDVVEVARCFTGWTISAPRKGGDFEYDDKRHDKGRKVVLGHVIKAGGGMSDGIEVLQFLSASPVTAHHISLQLAQRFVADDPPPVLVDRMTRTFLKTKGDLREVTRTMIYSPEFWSAGAYRAKVKPPFEMVVSAVRATNADVTSAFALVNEIGKLGEPLYRKIEPTGYSSANAEWINSGALLQRMNFGLTLAHNRVPGVTVATEAWAQEVAARPTDLAQSILSAPPSAPTEAAIQKALADPALREQLAQNAHAGPPQIPGLIAGLTLGSPEFQRR